jgi:hypothetical protein
MTVLLTDLVRSTEVRVAVGETWSAEAVAMDGRAGAMSGLARSRPVTVTIDFSRPAEALGQPSASGPLEGVDGRAGGAGTAFGFTVGPADRSAGVGGRTKLDGASSPTPVPETGGPSSIVRT